MYMFIYIYIHIYTYIPPAVFASTTNWAVMDLPWLDFALCDLLYI